MNTSTNPQTTQGETEVNVAKAQETAQNAGAEPGQKHDQLRRRVEARVRDLEATLSSLQSQQGNAERLRSLETELRLAQDCMAGGWERVGEMEAQKLTQWLDATQFMTDNKVVPDGSTVPGQVENAMEDGRTTVESSRPATTSPARMPQA